MIKGIRHRGRRFNFFRFHQFRAAGLKPTEIIHKFVTSCSLRRIVEVSAL